MKYFSKLTGDKVYLSPVNSDDYIKIVEWSNDPLLCEYLGTANKVVGLKDIDEFIKEKGEKGPLFAIITKSKDEFIGICYISGVEQIKRKADMTIFLSDLDYWKNGIAEDTANLLLDFGFNVFNMNNIGVQVYPCNNDVIECYQQCGMTIYGRRRNYVIR